MLQTARSGVGLPREPERWRRLRPEPREAGRTVRLLEVEPRIGAHLAGDALLDAHARLVAPSVEIDPGAWTPGAGLRRAMAVIVLDGKLLCEHHRDGAANLTLAGPGDVLDTRRSSHAVEWRAIEPTRMAVLDARFLLAARVWPQIVAGLADVMFASAREQAALAALAKLSRAEDRLAGFLALVAGRWGHVRPDGVVVSLPVTHETLGRLVGARRPTVTLALPLLAASGALRRLDRGRWWMPRDAVLPWVDDDDVRARGA